MHFFRITTIITLFLSLLLIGTRLSYGHGDVTPQAVDVTGLEKIGEEWKLANPYKTTNRRAIEIGCTAYNSNCARCHGLGVVSGGVAPDLRYLEKDEEGDEWYINRVRKGYHQNGITKMPAFEGLMPQEAMWAIRTYVNIRPEEDEDAVKPETGYSCQKIDYDLVTKQKSE